MANQEDIERAKDGKDIWNAWAKKELEKPWDQRVEADFSGFTFCRMDFSGFVFPRYANFKGTTFEDNARFKGAMFEGGAFFEGATFKGLAIFNNVIFKNWTDFTGATFQTAPHFHNAAIHQDTAFSFGEDFFSQFPDIESDEAEQCYRTLKLAMNKYQAHTEEAGFFKLELKARALKEPWYRRWMYKAYELFSDYGQSVSNPIIWWAGLGLVMFIIYALILGKPGEAFTVTLSQALPLIGVEKEALKEAMTALFPPNGNAPVWFQIGRALHMVASSAFIFLALLALRNRFKIK